MTINVIGSHILNLLAVLAVAADFFFITFLLRKKTQRKQLLKVKTQELEEENNILNLDNMKQAKNKLALNEKIKNYGDLKNIVEQLNQHLNLDSIADTLTQVAFSSTAKNRGTCILYRLDSLTNRLSVFRTRKEDKRSVIKAKEGDIFDQWILKHATALLIEDIKKDFRFDLRGLEPRALSSLISAPLISDHRFLGILRMDSPIAGFYSQDDLRLLVTISDLGAIALENGELFQRTQELAIHDELTSLYTKRYFMERLEEECRRSLRKSHPFSLLMLDIDRFKEYNDKFGHTSGDIVLRMLSRNISDYLGDSNSLISRFGGEELCIILFDVNKEDAYLIAEKIRKNIEKNKIILRQEEACITVSIGIASCPSDATDTNELILKADKAMYAAKQKGRNRICLI